MYLDKQVFYFLGMIAIAVIMSLKWVMYWYENLYLIKMCLEPQKDEKDFVGLSKKTDADQKEKIRGYCKVFYVTPRGNKKRM